MAISSISTSSQNAVDQSFAVYKKNVLGEDVPENTLNPVDKVEISDEAFRAAQAEAEARRNGSAVDTTETVGKVTFNRVTSGQRTVVQQPGAAEISDIVSDPVTATLSGGSTVIVYGQSYEDENGSGMRLMARIESSNGETHDFEVTASTIISEDGNGLITVKESMPNMDQNGTENNDVIISFGDGSINAGDGDDTILIFDIDRNQTVIGGTRVDITSGAGNDTVIAGNLYSSKVDLGDGNNSFSAKSLNTGTQVSAGDGNNDISIDKSDYAYVTLGNGNNSYKNKEQAFSYITTGNGNNSIAIGYFGGGSIKTGSGNDIITVDYAEQGSIRTGDGDDTVILTRANDPSFEWSGYDPRRILKIISNTLLDMGNGNNTIKLIENADMISIYSGKNSNTIVSLSPQAQLTNAILGENVTVLSTSS